MRMKKRKDTLMRMRRMDMQTMDMQTMDMQTMDMQTIAEILNSWSQIHSLNSWNLTL
jgi:hypothetical protein